MITTPHSCSSSQAPSDAVACDLSIAQYQMSAKPGVYTQLSDELSSEHYAVGVKKGNTELAQKMHRHPESHE